MLLHVVVGENSFFRNKKGGVVPLNKGIFENSQFYQGEGDYYLMNTCNKWTAKGLKSAGMDISPAFMLTAGSIMDYIIEHNQVLTIEFEGQIDSTLRSPASCR